MGHWPGWSSHKWTGSPSCRRRFISFPVLVRPGTIIILAAYGGDRPFQGVENTPYAEGKNSGFSAGWGGDFSPFTLVLHWVLFWFGCRNAPNTGTCGHRRGGGGQERKQEPAAHGLPGLHPGAGCPSASSA